MLGNVSVAPLRRAADCDGPDPEVPGVEADTGKRARRKVDHGHLLMGDA
ncbi:MAG TPA: hypothetical protein VFY87_16045 [Geminicoccaceae bacterium]|nr:hypothetical protein [Geminicoccaceae bacterium]